MQKCMNKNLNHYILNFPQPNTLFDKNTSQRNRVTRPTKFAVSIKPSSLVDLTHNY
jgi:hypothetical protein